MIWPTLNRTWMLKPQFIGTTKEGKPEIDLLDQAEMPSIQFSDLESSLETF